jgi:drug/metabolite transporter (DMT)-like permease
MVLWGISWPTSKMLTEYTDITTIMFLKFLLSSLTLMPIVYFLNLKLIFSKEIIKPTIFSLLFLLLYNWFMFYGLKVGTASLGGLIVTGTTPIFSFILIALFYNKKITPKQKLGLTLGLFGTLVTLNIFSFSPKEIFRLENTLFILASLFWAFVTFFSTQTKDKINSILFSLYLYLISSVLIYIFVIDTTKVIQIFEYDTIFWLNLIYTTIITTGLATTFYFKASNLLGANFTASFIFLVPIVAVVSSVIMLRESIQIETFIGGTILIFAIWLINKK